jgi:hypothetical protein
MKRTVIKTAMAVALVLGSAAAQDGPDSLNLVGSGSGFLITEQGHIITSNHVIQGCTSVIVQANGGKQQPAKVLAVDQENDLALLRADIAGQSYFTFRLDQRIKLGEGVNVVGFPLHGIAASSVSLTTGTISALAGIGDDTRMIQFTAPVQPGNSGGPLLDQRGNVIGIVTSKLSAAWAAKAIGDIPQNVNFAIRDSVLKTFLDSHSVEYKADSPSASTLQTTEIAERAQRGVVFVQCLRNERPSTISKGPTRRLPSEEVLRDAKSLCVRVESGSPVLKTEISKELLKWGKLSLVSQPDKADLLLRVVQTGQLDMMGAGNQAAAILIEPAGTELWTTTKGGSWAMSGWSNAWVGRAIAKDLIKFMGKIDRKR